MRERCDTVAAAIESLKSLEELDGFVASLRSPPTGTAAKRPTEADWQRIAERRIEMQRKSR